ncbi:MAG: folate family ECF transporter S component [Clostridiales bacterium]|nr:folate family ECF transporter S component [Clostridiales bacterium]
MRKLPTRKLTAAALLIAMSIVLTRLLSLNIFPPIVRLSAGNLPIYLASFWLGPVFGGLTGFAADFIGASLTTGWFPPISLAPVLTGILPGLFVRLSRKETLPWWQLLLLVLVCDVITELFWKALALSWMVGGNFLEILTLRAPFNLLQAVGQVALLFPLLHRLGLRPKVISNRE